MRPGLSPSAVQSRMKKYLLLLLPIFITIHSSKLDKNDHLVEDDLEEEEAFGIFQPTTEWQQVREGQSIPAGLHVRIDLKTGIKEAKLLAENEGSSSKDSVDSTRAYGDPRRAHYYGHSDRRGIINKSTKPFSRQQVSEMLEELYKTSSDEGNDVPLLSYSPDTGTKADISASQQKGKLVPLKEVRHLLSVHSEVEQMLQQMEVVIREPESPPSEVITALGELEYHVHQIDNAKDLDTIGGLKIVASLLDSQHSGIVAAAAHVLGSAAQSNPSVQEKILKYVTLPKLLQLLSCSQTELVQRRTIFLLSALLRGQSSATQWFLREGLGVLSSCIANRSLVVLTKMAVAMTDLLAAEKPEETKEYRSLGQRLSGLGWCDLSTLLISADNSLVTNEKGLHLMKHLVRWCDFVQQSTRLDEIHAQLNMMIETEGDESSAIAELMTIVDDVKMSINKYPNTKTEL